MTYQNLKSALTEFLKIYSSDDELTKTTYLSWANDSIEHYSNAQLYDIRVIPLTVKNYQAPLPDGFKGEIQLLYRKDCKIPSTRIEAIEWTQKMFGTDCNYIIKKECPKCSSNTSCTCGMAPITIIPDHLWQMNQSRDHYNTKAYVKEFSMGNTGKHPKRPSLGILPLSTNNFHTISLDTNDDCRYPNLSNRDEYRIQNGKIITSFKEGEILLAYKSVHLDEDGYRLIPDHPYAYEATIAYIMERKAFSDYSKSKSQNDRMFWSDQLQLREASISKALSYLSIPSEAEFEAFIQNIWTKVTPNHSAKYNLNRHKRDEYNPYQI